MVTDSASDSMLTAELGVIAGCCNLEGPDSAIVFAGPFCRKTSLPFAICCSLRENIWRSGDFSGAVLDRVLRVVDVLVDSGDGARLLFAFGNRERRGEGDEIRGDVALR